MCIRDSFRYQKNTVFLHSDPTMMPRNRKTWSSWNYLSNKNEKSSTTYWMNQLQELNTSLNVFVSLNPFKMPNKSLVHKKIIYEHPIFNNSTNEAQKLIDKFQGKDNIYFAGAWLGYGFHEDGISSAVKVAKYFDIKLPWEIK